MYKGDGNMASLREVSVTLQARWKEPASIESNVFVENGCMISRWLLQSRFARQLPPGGSPLFRSRVFFIKLYLCKITTAIFEIDFVSKLRPSKGLFSFAYEIVSTVSFTGISAVTRYSAGISMKNIHSPISSVPPCPLRVRNTSTVLPPRINTSFSVKP